MGFELFYSWQMMVLTFFKKTHDTPWRFVRKSNMLDLSFFMKSPKVSKTAWILSSHPSSWTLKPLCPKNWFSLWPM
jgi:hypothetical protein